MGRYMYQVKSGAGIYSEPTASAAHVKALVQKIAEEHHLRDEWVEVERILLLPGNGRRYWLQWGKRWRLYLGGEPPASVRKPAWGQP